MTDPIAVVECWITALNDADLPTLGSLSCADVEVVGIGASGFGRPLVEQWAARARLSAAPRRWFRASGRVVVECDATWHDAAGRPSGSRTIAMLFEVDRRKIACLARYASLDDALVVAGLSTADEVVHAAA